MPFQIKDETAGVVLLYIDNSNQMGFGSLPNAQQQLTVQGRSLVSLGGGFGCGMLPPGGQAGLEGSVFVAAGGQATVFLTASQIPTVTASLQSPTVNATQVVFNNSGSSGQTGNYAIY
jgi:hypothetical protein